MFENRQAIRVSVLGEDICDPGVFARQRSAKGGGSKPRCRWVYSIPFNAGRFGPSDRLDPG